MDSLVPESARIASRVRAGLITQPATNLLFCPPIVAGRVRAQIIAQRIELQRRQFLVCHLLNGSECSLVRGLEFLHHSRDGLSSMASVDLFALCRQLVPGEARGGELDNPSLAASLIPVDDTRLPVREVRQHIFHGPAGVVERPGGELSLLQRAGNPGEAIALVSDLGQ